MKDKISLAVIRRLPRYYRYLGELLANDIDKISSKELSARMGITASQIRQDLNCFGGFGQQGYGYNVRYLHDEISNILGLQNFYPAIVIGVGNLGTALIQHLNFEKRGFKLVGIFDVKPSLVGLNITGVTVQHIDELEHFFETHRPKIAVLAVPRSEAGPIADRLEALGIEGLWNFSNGDIHLKTEIPVENVHLGDSLMTLCYRINERGK
ncbi:redox-sensing transcriptional repressor Rex [Feifania hominis]|uniref:Redox-sensing transcriptional repressor Rex n=1 Tax=Feifania hominis TaxID=2763660 RepID=A0A926HUV3_9FIRM|nr:redox-sensing transcriptional repressor Rex [Feifania hominis]MBC8536688.1 redox-sensing transcriptional repressor Rex [Feifania hominis]